MGILYAFVVFSLLIASTLQITCSNMSPLPPNTNTNSDTCSRSQSSVVGYSDSAIYRTVVGQTSGNIYYVGSSSQGSTYRTIITVYTSTYSLVYTVAYPYHILLQSFAVTKTEWLMFFLELASPFAIVAINSTSKFPYFQP